MAPAKKVVILCDGTWCGRETTTQTNIYYLAEIMGINMNGPGDVHAFQRPGLQARYAEGVGMGETFLGYLFNGATGNDINEQCVGAYKYIVEHYQPHDEIWMFGLSRGAFTVRSVAGMINNCGVIRPRGNASDTASLCEEVYRIYRSHAAADAPQSPEMQAFRENASYRVSTPVKFLGAFDTVGGLGIPKFSGGIGFEWPEFYDQKVSSVVENVYHAVSLHDRFWFFQPCLAVRDPKHGEGFPIHQKWFPGVHYDLGRQRFRFLRRNSGWAEKILFAIPNFFSRTIEPNHVLSDLVLKWMLESIQQHDPKQMVVEDMEIELASITQRIKSHENIGDGDIYNHALSYIPFGKLINSPAKPNMFDNIIESILGIKTILQILVGVKDRRVPDSADAYDYRVPDASLGAGSAPISRLAGLTKKRYPSRTYENFQLYLEACGR